MVRSIRGKSLASHKQPSGHAPQPSSLGASLLLFSSPSLCRKAKPGFCYTMLPVACCLDFGLILNENRASPSVLHIQKYGLNPQPRTDRSGRGRSAARGRCKPCQHLRGKCRVCTGANIFIIFSLLPVLPRSEKTAQDFPRYAQGPASPLVKRVSHQVASLKTALTSI